MANTRPNISIPHGQWVDVNAALNAQPGFPAVTIGTALNVKLESSVTVRLCEKATTPNSADGYRTLADGDVPVSVTNDVGLWAFSIATDSTINVEVE